MPRRPFKLLVLRHKLLESKDFLQQINAAKNRNKVKSILFEATLQNLLTLEALIIAYFDKDQGIPLDRKSFQKLKRSGYL